MAQHESIAQASWETVLFLLSEKNFLRLRTQNNTRISAQFKCPQRTGFFPDPEECDLYYVCSQGEYEEKLCPDGLVFDDRDPNHERCDIPANVDCGDRTALQEPKPSKGCPRANGYYRHPDLDACDKFYNCVDGEPNELACPPGGVIQILRAKNKFCDWLKSIRFYRDENI
ncbi:hypothetical protein NQ315_005424 [Exocentrus adspersus]|uniref:Chitin-binding type-2 domain-containing protein n=1 Tax=Exocentrus adspersus TaxID=1586481 RepID=A0AAV8W3E0_9CUCU|nr:hypothetical protein NQ315_005424 [Exocentrus adspersus]